MTILLIEGMEDKYRKLLSASKNSDSDIAFFPSDWIYTEAPEPLIQEQQESAKIDLKTDLKQEAVSQPNTAVEKTVTEKAAILDSLSLFGDEKTKSDQSFHFEGGSIEKKESGLDHVLSEVLDLETWKTKLSLKFKSVAFDFKLFQKESPLVIFVSDSAVEVLNEDKPELSDLDYYFEANVSNLFSKMINAMRLNEDQYYMTSLKSNNLNEDFLLQEIILLKPTLIITLGAQATNYLLKSNMRLKDCHGKIHSIKIDHNQSSYDFSVMPLFSPHLLYSAPNMKKLAWKDMQAAMDYLNI